MNIGTVLKSFLKINCLKDVIRCKRCERCDYGFDFCHYFSSPGLSWDAMLNMIGIELELISDIDKHLFIEKGMRGGISYIAKKYGKANDKYMIDYDSIEESKFIVYLRCK